MESTRRVFAAIVFFFVFCCGVKAQEDENRLARPEWQLRADLEFQLACQRAKDILCRDIVRSIDADSESGSQSSRLKEISALLELSSDQVPSSLPQHKASLAYVESRKAAVIAWLKTYKTKGRELSKMALDREKAFAADQSELLDMSEKTVEEPKKPTTPPTVDRSDLRSKIIEIDRLFRASEKEFTSAKTTADKHDALNKHAEIFRQWGAAQIEQAWEFEVVVTDVVKIQGKYYALTQPPVLLESFNDRKKPLASDALRFELTDEQRKALNVSDKLLVNCMIRAFENNENNRLFSVRVTERSLQGMGNYLPQIIQPFQIDFVMNTVEISIVEVKKEKQTNSSKTPLRKK